MLQTRGDGDTRETNASLGSLRPRLREQLSPPALADGLVVIVFADVVSPIRSIVELGLTIAVAEPGEAVAGVLDVPVLHAQVGHGLEVVQGGARPERRDGAVGAALVPGAAGVGPHGLLHEVVLVGDKVLDRLLAGGELADVVGLVTVDHFHHIVRLAFCKRGSEKKRQLFPDLKNYVVKVKKGGELGAKRTYCYKDRAVSNGTIRSEEDHVVGESRGS